MSRFYNNVAFLQLMQLVEKQLSSEIKVRNPSLGRVGEVSGAGVGHLGTGELRIGKFSP
jgi:hypothetical protein